MKKILHGKDSEALEQAADAYRKSRCALALTGAGISVNSGIADFRSPGGLWSKFSPEEYADLSVFERDPTKSWTLFREMGKEIVGKEPNKGHKVLARLEQHKSLRGVITQNVDNLHQAAGSVKVLEIHGDHQHLQCLSCGNLVPVEKIHLDSEDVPLCSLCSYPYKPNVVLFGEAVRHLETIEHLILQCDLLMVIGTSAQVYPAATLPDMVKQQGGLIYEFNLKPALSTSSYSSDRRSSDYFFEGDLSKTLPAFEKAVLNN
jgi:NAD-dependent deacetylase